MFLVGWASLVSSYIGIFKSDMAEPSLEMNDTRLILLDRAENGDKDHSGDDNVPF